MTARLRDHRAQRKVASRAARDGGRTPSVRPRRRDAGRSAAGGEDLARAAALGHAVGPRHLRPPVTVGAAPRSVQRRVPDPAELEKLIGLRIDVGPTGDLIAPEIPNLDAHLAGVRTALGRKLDEIRRFAPHLLPTITEKSELIFHKDLATALSTGNAYVLIDVAKAMIEVAPEVELGDPRLINAPPQNLTEATNVQTLVDKTNGVFDKILGGAWDGEIMKVFGDTRFAAARTKFQNAKTWLNKLHSQNKIVSDRSGFPREVQVGGLTAFQHSIFLEPGVIDNPTDNESIITTLHESTHAGNSDVNDYGYPRQPSFSRLAEDVKLNNASHFEEVARRVLKQNPVGGVFKPYAPSGSGGEAGEAKQWEKALRIASERFRHAWTVALNVHRHLVDLYKNPQWWTYDLGGGLTYAKAIPYYSKVENLTIHRKTQIDPTDTDLAKRPVTLIDIALNEGMTRRLAWAMNGTPKDLQASVDLLRPVTSKVQILDLFDLFADEHKEARLIMEQVLTQRVGPITGSVKRDMAMVEAFHGIDLDKIIAVRDPASFHEP